MLDDLRPWVPPGAREFQVGDRVKVRLSGECRLTFRRQRMQSGQIFASGVTHEREADQQTGIIKECETFDDGHSLHVRFDEEIETPDGYLVLAWYAPSELDLLEAAS
jgi:hypothetical protein